MTARLSSEADANLEAKIYHFASEYYMKQSSIFQINIKIFLQFSDAEPFTISSTLRVATNFCAKKLVLHSWFPIRFVKKGENALSKQCILRKYTALASLCICLLKKLSF